MERFTNLRVILALHAGQSSLFASIKRTNQRDAKFQIFQICRSNYPWLHHVSANQRASSRSSSSSAPLLVSRITYSGELK